MYLSGYYTDFLDFKNYWKTKNNYTDAKYTPKKKQHKKNNKKGGKKK